MPIDGQSILPAIRKMKEFERTLTSPYTYIVLLDSHIGQLKGIARETARHNKKLILHADLIQGLKNDEYAAEYLIQEIKPAGLISTRASVILKAKQKGVLAIQRMFLLDSTALQTSYKLLERTQPDYIEVLPGVMPHIIKEVALKTGIPIFAGGFIRTPEEVSHALEAGAVAVTTSRKELIDHFKGR
ncbi:glycerol-3-phosphate responsive antiterminator [Bacillus marinisedimentorum]|uniref:glycerol-3-phosphate responsive antiterminator n=1 Tax=Bacillus marinisedimentorum TaxID=1821260 RepID=UPI0007E28EFB|nr:glycerol-3-phosphate responsive antiterminator [Bacillus marinisedimentorum]